MRALGVLTLVSAIALSGCAKPEGLQVVDPVIRLSANPRAPSVGYFTLKGGPTADRLLSVTSPLVIRIELHESMTASGMATMKPLDGGVEVPANGTIKFQEGGKHAMLFDVNPGVKANEKVQLNFTFASGTILQTFAPVRGPGG
ncbi:MAG: copper chaperone PCu(A)C [Sphingomonadales bacterium]